MASYPRAPEDLLDRVNAALPIDDIVGWLCETYPGSSEQQVMAMLQKVYQADGYAINPSGPQRKYAIEGKEWSAFPQRVEGK